jgi:RNA polymerase sigma factor (sigma-70 family)
MLDVEALYRAHHRDLHRVLSRRFRGSLPDALVEDACASAWAIAWAQRERVRDENPMAWMVTVARHEALALLRKRRHELPVDGGTDRPGNGADPELALAARESLELLAQLSPNQRLALSLRTAGFRYQEIAEVTGKTYTWANRHISEGRARLRRLADQA